LALGRALLYSLAPPTCRLSKTRAWRVPRTTGPSPCVTVPRQAISPSTLPIHPDAVAACVAMPSGVHVFP